MKRTIFSLLLIVLLSVPAIFSFFHPGFMVSDDGGWMVIRLAAFYDALRDGQIPVRWVNTLNFGYGYPVTHFLYPAFLYIGAPIALVTSNFVLTIKILFVASILIGPVGMYLWLSKKFGIFASIIGAMVYVYAPYHLFTTITRGSLGEVLFLAVLPFLLWAMQEKKSLLVALLFGLLLISHNTLALLFLPIIFCFAYILKKNVYKNLKDLFIPLLLGIGISVFFWIPALVDLSATRFFKTSVSDFSLYFSQLSFVAIPLITIIAGAIIFLKQKKRGYMSVEGLMIFIGFVTIFMSLGISKFVWDALPVSFIQFPFRFLAVAILAGGYLTAYSLSKVKFNTVLGVVLLSLTVIFSRDYLQPKDYNNYPDSYYFTNQSTTTIKNEYMPIAVNHDPAPDTNNPVLTSGSIISSSISSNAQIFSIKNSENTSLYLGQVYFPGWVVSVDGIQQNITVVKDSGIMKVDLAPGEHQVIFSFKETGLRLLVDLVSIASALIAIWFYGVKKYAKR